MRLVIVSNRLPVTISKELPAAETKRSIGGLVTGISSYLATIGNGQTCFDDYVWVGWPGAFIEPNEWPALPDAGNNRSALVPVFLDEHLVQQYYYGFCNKILWPLFHYFPNYIEHDAGLWAYYVKANEAFCTVLKEQLREDDVVWIHDYHLMLLPQMLRRHFPDLNISFFLHIPFPTNDIFRFLGKTEQRGLLEGLLGADVIGFHTNGYTQNFLHCISRTLKLSHEGHEIAHEDRSIKVDVFPMGIDYRGIQDIARSEKCVALRKKISHDFAGYKLILSIDRLDYTKGILNRLMTYNQLLQRFPQWREKVVLMLIVAPSRREITAYQQIKRSIDEWVGNINGSYGTSTWVPVIYQYRQFHLPELCAVYGASHVGMITPLCDGMNLIAKEFIAAHTDRKGVLVLSEMAGAIDELTDAVAVNPNNIEEMVLGLVQALSMEEDEIAQRNERMHHRIAHYDVRKWANDILTATAKTHENNPKLLVAPGI